MVRINTPFRIARQSSDDMDLRSGHWQADHLERDGGEANEPTQKRALRRKRPFEDRHRRNRIADVDRWVFPDEGDDRDTSGSGHNLVRWSGSQLSKAFPGGRYRWTLGLFAGLLLLLSMSVAFDLVGPSDSHSSPRMGDALGTDPNRADQFDMLAEIEKIRLNAVSSTQPPRSNTSDETTPSTQTIASQQAAHFQSPRNSVMATRDDAPAPFGGVATNNRTTLAASAVEEPEVIGQTDGAAESSTLQKDQSRLQTTRLSSLESEEPETLQHRPSASSVSESEKVLDRAQSAELGLSTAMVEKLLARGELLLRGGDIVSARLMFLSAAEAGDLRGAWGVGMTYDPDVHTHLAVTGDEPDREQAKRWYKKAGAQSAFLTIDEKSVEEPEPVVSEADERNAACARKYKSFNPKTGLYRSYSGVMRRCRLR